MSTLSKSNYNYEYLIIFYIQINKCDKTLTSHQFPMAQLNCKLDGNVQMSPHQNRYYLPMEGDFEFVSIISYVMCIYLFIY